MTTLPTPALSPPADLLRLIAGADTLCVDLETCGPEGQGMDGALNPRQGRIRLLSLSDGGRHLVMDAFSHPIQQILPAMADRMLVAHNAAFDLGFLWQAGLKEIPRAVCTQLVEQLLTAGEGEGYKQFGPHSLASCTFKYLNRQLPKELQKSDWSGPLSAEQIEYARRDVIVLTPIVQGQGEALKKADLVRCSEIELACLPAWVWLRQSGVPFDVEAWTALAERASTACVEIEAKLNDLAPPRKAADLFGDTGSWNWRSPDQVKEVFAQRLGLDLSTTADAQLALLDDPLANLLREHRHQSKLLTMYGTGWLDCVEIAGGRVYPDWRQLGAASGRTSCAGPNCQQIPRDEDEQKRIAYKVPFTAPPGRVLVKADYSQLQMRIACRFAEDNALLQAFRSGQDVHTLTAQALLGRKEVTKADRQIAKSANFRPALRSRSRGSQDLLQDHLRHRPEQGRRRTPPQRLAACLPRPGSLA